MDGDKLYYLLMMLGWCGTPHAIIGDGDKHFCNPQFKLLLAKYGIRHCIAILYHPQSSVQFKIANKELKRILEVTVSSSRKDCSKNLIMLCTPTEQLSRPF